MERRRTLTNMMAGQRVTWALLTCIAAATASAGTVSISLPSDKSRFLPGPNQELVNEACRECHSADYVSSQPILDRAGWQKVITKMLTKYHMDPLSTTEQDMILDYLVSTYGAP